MALGVKMLHVKHAALALFLLVPSSSLVAQEKPGFGPWDAGQRREVSRQGKKGIARAAHPSVGDVAKVPGAGPPPPPLSRDPDLPEAALATVNAVGSSLSSNPLYLASLTYAHFITKVDGPRCQHIPTCSRFASQAVAKHGAVGILMGLDRVIRPNNSSAVRGLPEVESHGGLRGYDPVENYEFWNASAFTGFPPPTPEVPLALGDIASRSDTLGESQNVVKP